MKVGMNLPVMVPGLDRNLVLDWAARVDSGPYSSIAAGERINFPNPEITVLLSAVAVATERVAIHYDVLVLPLHSEVLIAKQVATLDVLSAGRVCLGVGTGGREEDYAAVGASLDDKRWSRVEEQVARLRRFWSGEKAVDSALAPVEPFPLQGASLPVLAGAITAGGVRRAARFADGITGFHFDPSTEAVGATFENARRAWREAERDTPPRLVTGFWFALGAGARAQMDAYLERYLAFLGSGVPSAVAPGVTVVSAQALRDAVKRIADLGGDEVLLVPTTSDPDEVDRVADLLA